MERAAQFVGAKDSRKPDNGRQQILRQTSSFIPNVSKLSSLEFCSEIVTNDELLPQINWFDVASRLCPMRELRLVKSRKPKAFRPHPEKDPNYILAFVVETLECGHQLEFNFIADAEPLTAKRRVCPECSKSSSLPKKPSGSVGDSISSRLRNLLEKADVEIDAEKRAAIMRSIRELSKKVRAKKQAGESLGWSLGFAVLFVIAFAAVLRMAPPVRTWRVLERSSDSRFVIQEFKDGAPQQAKVYDTCDDGPRAQLEPGFTLTEFNYVLRKDGCISLQGLHYTILRDSNKCPVVPKNCWHNCAVGNHDHNVCNGVPQFD